MQKQVDVFLDDEKIGFVQTDDDDNNMGLTIVADIDFDKQQKIEKYINSNYNKIIENSITIVNATIST